MATEVTALGPGSGAELAETLSGPAGLAAQLRQLGAGRILALGVVALALMGFFAFVIARSLEQPMTLLFGSMAPAETQQIIARLDALGVAYRLGSAGDSVMVPADRALRLRIDLAQEGLPSGGGVGYEVFDKSSQLGSTDFLSNLNLKRALEGELARTIGSIRSVQHARVHIVLPRRELFERDRQPPTASIVLAMRATGGLDPRQVQGIRNLVAAAVPGLDPGQVTVVDDRGNLLSRPSDRGNGLVAQGGEIDELRSAYEQRIKAKILQLLERSLGPGRVEAEVTADMDFDEVTTTAESYDPASQVARSSQTVEETGDRREASPTAGVSVANNLPTQAAAPQAAGSATTDRSARNEETINYEISRTVHNQSRRGGVLRRLSIAVQVDGIPAAAADGTRTVQPRPAEELAQLAALVRSAAGVDEERGDVVEVVSRPFAVIEPAAAEEPLLTFTREEYWRLGELAGLGLLTLLVLLFGVRPLIRSFLPKAQAEPGDALLLAAGPGGQALAAITAGEPTPASAAAMTGPDEKIDLLNVQGGVSANLVNELSRVVEARPDDTVRVIRSWLHGS